MSTLREVIGEDANALSVLLALSCDGRALGTPWITRQAIDVCVRNADIPLAALLSVLLPSLVRSQPRDPNAPVTASRLIDEALSAEIDVAQVTGELAMTFEGSRHFARLMAHGPRGSQATAHERLDRVTRAVTYWRERVAA